MLHKLQTEALKLHRAYTIELITLKEYLALISPIDKQIDSLELSILSCSISDKPSKEET